MKLVLHAFYKPHKQNNNVCVEEKATSHVQKKKKPYTGVKEKDPAHL